MIKTFSISIPTDGKGFVGRACSSKKCRQYFKIGVSWLRETLFCPYCGESMPKASLLTREQFNYVREAGTEEIKAYAIAEVHKMFKQAFSGSQYITYKPLSPPSTKSIFARYNERTIDTELQCSECDTRFQVYGIFGFCPTCKCENLQIYDANWGIIKRNLNSAKDKRTQLRHAYGDLISTFEFFCARKAKRFANEAVNFQSLFEARKFFKDHAEIDILATIPPPALLSLRRAFQKRHICIHAGGIVTERYVKMIPEDKAFLGRTVELSEAELEEAASAIRAALGELVRSIERPGK